MALRRRRFSQHGALYLPTGAAPPSNPLALFGANLVAWYDAHTGVTGTSPVSAWADQSGNGFNLAGGTGPAFNATGFNSGPTLTFSAAGLTRLDTGSGVVTSWPAATPAGAFFIVGQMTTNTGSFGRALALCGSANSTDFSSGDSASVINRDATNNNIECFRGSGARALAAVSLSTNMRMGMVFDGVNCTSYVNNVAGASTATNINWGTVSTLRVGGDLVVTGGVRSTPSAMWDGPISEVVVLKQSMTSTERGNLDDWFKFNWGL